MACNKVFKVNEIECIFKEIILESYRSTVLKLAHADACGGGSARSTIVELLLRNSSASPASWCIYHKDLADVTCAPPDHFTFPHSLKMNYNDKLTYIFHAFNI